MLTAIFLLRRRDRYWASTARDLRGIASGRKRAIDPPQKYSLAEGRSVKQARGIVGSD